jgi:hypothetical protein
MGNEGKKLGKKVAKDSKKSAHVVIDSWLSVGDIQLRPGDAGYDKARKTYDLARYKALDKKRKRKEKQKKIERKAKIKKRKRELELEKRERHNFYRYLKR